MLHMDKHLTPPPKPPRVSVPVNAHTLEVFKRLAKAGNLSTGSAIAEWLDDTVEAAELMAATLERARAAPKVVTAELHAMMLGMADQTKELADKYRKFKGPLVEGGGGADALAPPATPSPRLVIRGGKSPNRRGKSQ